MKQIASIIILGIVSLSLLTGCSNGDLAQQREKYAGQGDTILIGVPVPLEFASENTKFLKGIELAVEDINREGINGKKIKVEIVDDKGIFKDAVDIAQSFADNTRMTAVIGHWYSDICLPISKIYEDAGMLTIVPTVSNPELTQKGYQYIFQNITSDNEIAKQMCSYAKQQGYHDMVIVYEDSSYGENLAHAIEDAAESNDLRIVDRTSGLVTEEQFKKAHDKWMALDFDAVLLALNMPEGGRVVNQLRSLNQEVGMISADGLDVANFQQEVGKNGEEVAIITTYNPANSSPALKQFTEKYQQKYNEAPDVWAVQGYDSLQLIAHAVEETGQCSPPVLAEYLHTMTPYQTVLGRISFNDHGESAGRGIYKKIVVDGKINYFD